MVRRLAWAAGGGAAAMVALAVLAVSLLSSSAVAATPAASSGSVRLELSPRTARPGEKLRLVVVNDSSRTVYWGGCFEWQRLIDGRQLPAAVGQCLALVVFRAHSRRNETASAPASDGPGRYRISFLYQDSAATLSRSPLAARAYLTVVAAAIRKGILTGAIKLIGGAPSPHPRPPSSGEVAVYASAVAHLHRVKGQEPVWSLTGREVAHEHVAVGHYFRFRLTPGRYQIELTSDSNCRPSPAVVRAGRTSHADVDYGCGVP